MEITNYDSTKKQGGERDNIECRNVRLLAIECVDSNLAVGGRCGELTELLLATAFEK